MLCSHSLFGNKFLKQGTLSQTHWPRHKLSNGHRRASGASCASTVPHHDQQNIHDGGVGYILSRQVLASSAFCDVTKGTACSCRANLDNSHKYISFVVRVNLHTPLALGKKGNSI